LGEEASLSSWKFETISLFFAEFHKRERKLKQEMLDLKEEFSLKLAVRTREKEKERRKYQKEKKQN
jgi:hypothetical protein